MFAKDFGRILRTIQNIRNHSPGRIDASTKEDGTQSFSVRPFEVTSKTREGDAMKKELDEASHATGVLEYGYTL